MALDSSQFAEVASELAVSGPTDELAARLEMTRDQLARAIGKGAPREVLRALRRELAERVADRLLLVTPRAVEELQLAVEAGDMRAIENVLDRAGFPKVSRTDIRAAVLHARAPALDFREFIERGEDGLDEAEAALGRMREEAEKVVEGEWEDASPERI